MVAVSTRRFKVRDLESVTESLLSVVICMNRALNIISTLGVWGASGSDQGASTPYLRSDPEYEGTKDEVRAPTVLRRVGSYYYSAESHLSPWPAARLAGRTQYSVHYTISISAFSLFLFHFLFLPFSLRTSASLLVLFCFVLCFALLCFLLLDCGEGR